MPPDGFDRPTLQQDLVEGLSELGIEASEQQQDKLLDFLQLLVRWNSAYNLTAVREPGQMIGLHILDSLSLIPHLKGQRCIDVGTGPGLPGIPLAIMQPQKQFTLLDSNGKRVRFLFQVRNQLGLLNVEELHDRVEHYKPVVAFDSVLSRAFSSLPDMVGKCRHLLAEGGCFLAMKGKFPQTELSDLPKGFMVGASQRLNVPGVEGERHVIELITVEN